MITPNTATFNLSFWFDCCQMSAFLYFISVSSTGGSIKFGRTRPVALRIDILSKRKRTYLSAVISWGGWRPSRCQKTSGLGDPWTGQSSRTLPSTSPRISLGKKMVLAPLPVLLPLTWLAFHVGGVSTMSWADADAEPTEFSASQMYTPLNDRFVQNSFFEDSFGILWGFYKPVAGCESFDAQRRAAIGRADASLRHFSAVRATPLDVRRRVTTDAALQHGVPAY